MKKFIAILVLGLLWCEHSLSEWVKFNCKNLQNVKPRDYIVYAINTDDNTFKQIWRVAGEEEESLYVDILNVNGTELTYTYYGDGAYVYKFDYGKNKSIDYQIKPSLEASISCVRHKQ